MARLGIEVAHLEMSFEELGDRHVAVLEGQYVVTEPLQPGDSSMWRAVMPPLKAMEVGRRLYRLGQACHALDAGDSERFDRIVAMLNDPDSDTEEID